MKTRPYPWKCHTCREHKVRPLVVDYRAQLEHDGRSYDVEVPRLEVLECEACHTRVLTDEAYEKLNDQLRAQVGLLRPAEIRHARERLGLTQQELAARLGVAEATISRWETGGQIQQRSLDRFLRCFFAFPVIQQALTDDGAVLNSVAAGR